ncbi:MAG: hypothetical protein KKA65_04665 [Nanoarchaeota archaeon]|nr:hypothetical protein [Nanoarchaeota archaeon]MBU4351888.1 hypothetical protein [Nanoarchaeota archaeon]MBU4456768.1 hypothetical protein [Nanoarchaeota archaeon]MCG2719659.1 hypothetical protein [Nanoarchaeota archaeon]
MKISKGFYKNTIILLLTFILLINISLAAENETVEDLNLTEETNLSEEVVVEEVIAEQTIEEEEIELCGNNLIDAGETCMSCPPDVRCKSGEICDAQTEQCTKQSDLTLYIVIGLLFMAIIGFIIFRASRKKNIEEPKQNIAPVQPVQQLPTQGRIQATAEQNKAQLEPITSIEKPVQEPKVAQKPIVQQPKTIKEDELQGYIQQMRAKGVNDESIRQKLRKEGWKDNKIAIAFLTMKNK